jgi:RNA-directed DNA polymerase
LERIRQLGREGGEHVLDADIENCFGSIAHDRLLTLVRQRVSDRRMLKLARQWLRAGVMEDGVVSHPVAGTPQGGVISPLLANICLHVLDRLGLKLHPQKTRRVALKGGLEGFELLGCHLRKRMSGRQWQQRGLVRYCLQRWPSRKAMNRVRERVRELTPSGRCHQDVRSVIAEINPVLRGWGQYCQTGNAADHFIDVGDCVVKRLRSLRIKRAGRHLQPGQTRRWDRDYFESLGLRRLRGTIRYPGKETQLLATGNRVMLRADGPLVSRVREIRMHGLNGDVGSVTDLRA